MRRTAVLLSAIALLSACGSSPRTAHAPTEVPWARAEELILTGAVVEVEHREDGTVRLHLTDGRHLVAAEPAQGVARDAIGRCGEPCAKVKIR